MNWLAGPRSNKQKQTTHQQQQRTNKQQKAWDFEDWTSFHKHSQIDNGLQGLVLFIDQQKSTHGDPFITNRTETVTLSTAQG